MERPAAFGAELRGSWELEPGAAFLNHGSYGAVPRRVSDVREAWQRRIASQPVKWLEWARLEGVRRAAEVVAEALGVSGSEVALVDNATTGANVVLRSLRLQPGDRLLTTSHVYNAVDLALQHVAARSGAEVVHVDLPFPVEDPSQLVEAFAAALRGDERIAVVDWISSATGLVFPVHELVARCHAAGVPVLVDGAHAPGQVEVDLAELGADWFVGNLHKWMFAPPGCAVLHAAPGRAENLVPSVISHGLHLGFPSSFDWLGTRDPSPWLCAVDAIAFTRWLGEDAMRAYNRGLRAEAVELLTDAWGSPAPAPAALTANMATLRPPIELPPTAEAAAAVHDALWERHRIEVPVFPFGGRSWLRISSQVYNTLDDYRRLAAAIGPEGVR